MLNYALPKGIPFQEKAFVHPSGQKSASFSRSDIFSSLTERYTRKSLSSSSPKGIKRCLFLFPVTFITHDEKVHIRIIQAYKFRTSNSRFIENFQNSSDLARLKMPSPKSASSKMTIHFRFLNKNPEAAFYFLGPITFSIGSTGIIFFRSKYL